MPGGVLHAAFAAAAAPTHVEAQDASTSGVRELWPASASGTFLAPRGLRARPHYTSAVGEAGTAADQASKGAGGGKDSSKVLLFTSQTGKSVELNGESHKKCIQSCDDAPELKDENQSGTAAVMSVASGGESRLISDCINFCDEEFAFYCFPGDSSVVVRDRGSVRIADLQVGDSVLALRSQGPEAEGQWELFFDTVINWLHRSPDAEGEVLQIRHEAGQVQLTANHLIFARKPGRGVAVPCLADEVRPGDRVLAPWVDGSVAEPAVLSVERVRKRGLYAPLVACGTVLVDGTAASCYAMAMNLQSSRLLQRVARLANGRGLHAAMHAVFLPLRLLHVAGAAAAPASIGAAVAAVGKGLPAPAVAAAKDEEKQPKDSNAYCKEAGKDAPIHPYAWALYVLAASFLT